MARIRTIKPEFWSDEKLAPLPSVDRFVFLGLVSMADDSGRVLDNTKIIDAFVFPETDETCVESIDVLEELGRIVRGKTHSDQSVIQIVNWHHQKIDKPNVKSALPSIVGYESFADRVQVDDVSTTIRRRRADVSLRSRIWSRDGGRCCSCGRTGLRATKNKYDSGDDIGEVDHIIAVADGGTDDELNLQLLCRKCNRTKQGQETINRNSANRVQVDDVSTIDRRLIADKSTPLSPTNDQRPTNSDQKENGACAPKEKQKRFVKPTLQEVEAYCEDRDNAVPAQKFIDHYESVGWKVGKGNKPMVNWKAAIRSVWEPNHPKPASRLPTPEEDARWNPVDGGLSQ